MAEIKGVGAERRKVRAEEKATMATDVHAIRDQIIAATADIRRKMTQKYQVEF
jgi:DNA-binding protein YbaB